MLNYIKKSSNEKLLFICLIIPLIPTVLYNRLITGTLYTAFNALAFGLQVLMGCYILKRNNIDVKEFAKKYKAYVIIAMVILFFSQLINIIKGLQIQLNDIVNIFSVIINVILFIVLIPKIKLTEDGFINFMKLILGLAMASCVYNVFVLIDHIPVFFKGMNSYNINLDSFFQNRNQYGLFLVVAIMSNIFLLDNNNIKKYRITLIILIVSLLLTLSRTAMIAVIIAVIAKYLVNDKTKNWLKNNYKKCIAVLGIAIAVLALLSLISPNILGFIDDLFIRSDTITSGSGRVNIWINGIDIVTSENLLSGTGRFQALELLSERIPKGFTHFHNVMIEAYAMGGIIGLIAYIYLIYKIFTKVKNSDMQAKYKKTYLGVFCAYLVVSTLESVTRFSIGYVDTIAILFYMVIPLMFSNNCTKQKEENVEEVTNIGN